MQWVKERRALETLNFNMICFDQLNRTSSLLLDSQSSGAASSKEIMLANLGCEATVLLLLVNANPDYLSPAIFAMFYKNFQTLPYHLLCSNKMQDQFPS
jgi:hypothetical protein